MLNINSYKKMGCLVLRMIHFLVTVKTVNTSVVSGCMWRREVLHRKTWKPENRAEERLACLCESIRWGWAVTNKAVSSSLHGPSLKHCALMTESLLWKTQLWTHMHYALTDFSISHIFIFELYIASAPRGVNANRQNNSPCTSPMPLLFYSHGTHSSTAWKEKHTGRF